MMMMMRAVFRRFFVAGEPAASRAAEDRRTTDGIRRRARFADCCRDNRLAHQRRCDRRR